MIRALFSAVAVFLMAGVSPAQAQCSGQFAAGTVCGNPTGSTALPRSSALSAFGTPITDNNALTSTVFPVWATAAGNVSLDISTTKLQFKPSTGAIGAGGVAPSSGIGSEAVASHFGITSVDGSVVGMLGSFGTGGVIVGSFSSHALAIVTNNAPRINIGNTGNIGISTSGAVADIGNGTCFWRWAGASNDANAFGSGCPLRLYSDSGGMFFRVPGADPAVSINGTTGAVTVAVSLAAPIIDATTNYRFKGQNATLPVLATASGSANAITLTPQSGSAPASQSTFNEYLFKATASNTAATTVTIGAIGPFSLFIDGFSGPSAAIGGEVFANNWYSVGYDATVNSGSPGWRLTPGQSSGAVMAPIYKVPGFAYANPAGIAPYNYMGGIPSSSGIPLPEYGGHQPCFLDANCVYFGQAYQWLSNDPTMTTQQSVTNAVSSGGKIRVTLPSVSGISNGDPITISLVGGVPNATGLWSASSVGVPANTVTLNGWNGAADSVFAGAYTSGGLATYGELDSAIYHLIDSVVVARIPLFNDSLGFYGWQGQSTTGGVGNDAVVPAALITSFIVDPNTAQAGAQSRISFGIASNFAGGKNIGNVMTLGQGIIATGCSGDFPNGASPTTAPGWIAQDFGHGTVNALQYYAGSLTLPVPRIGDSSNLLLFKVTNTTGRITADSLTVQGPVTGVSCGKANVRLYTTLRNIDKTVNFATTGAGGLDVCTPGPCPVANTPYAVFIIAKSSDGTVNILASLSATAPTMPSGYDTMAFVGWFETAPGAATLLDNVQVGAVPNGRPFFTITGAVTIDSNNANAYQNAAVLAGGGASYTITIGTTTGFANAAELPIVNADNAFTKTVSPSGLSSVVLPPMGSAVVKNINGTWYYTQVNLLSVPTGTSGGIPYYSSTTSIASSALLAADQIVTGGGAGVAPKTTAAVSISASTGAMTTVAGVSATSKSTGSIVISGTGGLGVGGATFTDTLNVITMASTAQTNVVCYNTTTGLTTYQTWATGCAVSTAEAKENFGMIPDDEALRVTIALTGLTYNYRRTWDLGDDLHAGFTSQDVAAIQPLVDSVGRSFDLATRLPDGRLAGVKYQEMPAILVGAVRAIYNRSEALRADNDNLRALNDNLSRRLELLERNAR